MIFNQTKLVKMLLENGAETNDPSSQGKIFQFTLYAIVIFDRNLLTHKGCPKSQYKTKH